MKKNENSIEIGKRIRELRKLNRLTQTELGNNLKLTKQTIRKYEHGDRSFSNEFSSRLANALHVPTWLITDGIDNRLADKFSLKDFINDDGSSSGKYNQELLKLTNNHIYQSSEKIKSHQQTLIDLAKYELEYLSYCDMNNLYLLQAQNASDIENVAMIINKLVANHIQLAQLEKIKKDPNDKSAFKYNDFINFLEESGKLKEYSKLISKLHPKNDN